MDRAAIKHLPASFEQIGSKLAGAEIPKTQNIVSLFAGCGGLDLGFTGGFKFNRKTYDRLPFEIIWANEIDKYACQIYRENMNHEIIEGDIWDIIKAGDVPKKVDILLGGFPCQDFSQAGKRRGFQSERGTLYRAMVEMAKILRPKVFIAENVQGLLSIPHALETIKNDFADAGYHGIEAYPVQASDYGIPQKRSRVFIIGWRHKKHANAFEFPTPQGIKPLFVKQAINDLADKDWEEVDGHTWALAKRRADLQGNETTPADGFAYTIRAEHHMNIQYHYNDKRRLSVREAARLQTFPDTFKLGGVSKNQGYRMIGNAVPPVLAWRIACAVREALA